MARGAEHLEMVRGIQERAALRAEGRAEFRRRLLLLRTKEPELSGNQLAARFGCSAHKVCKAMRELGLP